MRQICSLIAQRASLTLPRRPASRVPQSSTTLDQFKEDSMSAEQIDISSTGETHVEDLSLSEDITGNCCCCCCCCTCIACDVQTSD